jgi:hypothetical protein
VQTRSITRGFRVAAGAAALVGLFLRGAPRAQAPESLTSPEAPPASTAQWREAPEYVDVFVPRIYRLAYRAYVSGLSLDEALRAVTADPGMLLAPGSWIAHPENPLDAFGNGGTYDRWRLARLFGSRRPAVARGPRGRNGIVEESWTLIAPYPSADLNRLEPGTLLIVVRVP